MNFLLGASIIVLLLFPGFIARLMYLNTRHNRGFSFGVVEELLFSLVPTLFIHLICIPIALWVGFHIDYLYLMIISHESGSSHLNMSSLVLFILYCLFTYFVAFCLGFGMQRLAMVTNWDINIPLFRIHNEWYYLLRGFFHTPPNTRRRQFVAIDDIKIDAIVEVAGKSYIYSGYIREFVLCKNEGLDRIYLRDTVRIPLEGKLIISKTEEVTDYESNDRSGISEFQEAEDTPVTDELNMKLFNQLMREDEESYFIPGDMFVLSFSEIKNMNISYEIAEEITGEVFPKNFL